MDPLQRTYFLAAIAETAKLIRLSQAALQRARMQCDGEVAEHINTMATRIYELQVRTEWIQHVALGNERITLPAIDPDSRQGPDRRVNVDRRIAGLRQRLEGESD